MFDLCYSPDENGWYWQRTDTWQTSQLFRTKTAATRAMETGKIRWS